MKRKAIKAKLNNTPASVGQLRLFLTEEAKRDPDKSYVRIPRARCQQLLGLVSQYADDELLSGDEAERLLGNDLHWFDASLMEAPQKTMSARCTGRARCRSREPVPFWETT